MKFNKHILYAVAALSLASCSEKMDYHEYKVDGAEYIQEMFSRTGGLITTIYQNLDSDFGNYSDVNVTAGIIPDGKFEEFFAAMESASLRRRGMPRLRAKTGTRIRGAMLQNTLGRLPDRMVGDTA